MYPSTARQVAYAANPLLTALRNHSLVTPETGSVAVQIDMHGDAVLTVHTSTTPVGQTFGCPPQIYQALYTIFRNHAGSTTDAALLLEAGSPTIAMTDAAVATAWLRDIPVGPTPHAPHAHAAPTFVSAPAPAAPAAVLLASHRSDHIVPLDGRFDATAVIYGGATPAGVRVVAVVQDEFSNVLILTQPTDTGMLVQDAQVKALLLGLLTSAQAVEGDAVVCDLRSQRLFAVSRAAMASILARQEIPNLEPPLVGQMTAYAPTFLVDAAMHARAWAIGGDTFRKVWATILFFVCAGLTIACTVFWYWAGVYPLIWTATRLLTGTDLDAAATTSLALTTTTPQVVVGGVVGLSAIRLFAWAPSLLEFVGVMFSSFRWMQHVLLVVAGADVFGNTIYYFLHFYPNVDGKSPLVQVVLIVSVFTGALMWSIVAALGFEPLAIILVVMAVALSPVVPWALRSSIEGLGKLVLHIYYGAVGIGDTLSAQRTILQAEASTTQYVYVQGAPPARRSPLAVVQTLAVMLLVVGIVALGGYLLIGRGR